MRITKGLDDPVDERRRFGKILGIGVSPSHEQEIAATDEFLGEYFDASFDHRRPYFLLEEFLACAGCDQHCLPKGILFEFADIGGELRIAPYKIDSYDD